jgi:MFS family permease
MRERSWRTVAAVGGLLGLVGVVAVAAAGHAPGGGESRPSADAPKLVADYLATFLAVLMPLGAIVVVFALAAGRAQHVKKEKGKRIGSTVMGLAALAAVLIIVTQGPWAGWLNRDNDKKGGASAQPAKAKPGKDKAQATKRPESYDPQFRWVPVFVVGSLILGIGGAMAVFAVRRKRRELLDAPVVVALSELLAETLDDLRREADPRRAVIRAYAKMEDTLAAKGLPRLETEAPFEYLARVLDIVQASGHSVRALTQLFQRARFSAHEIDAHMKDDAIDALSGLRAELEAAR